MFEIPADAPVVVIVAVGVIYILEKGIGLFRSMVLKDAQADEAAVAERERWMAMLNAVLDQQHARYAGLTTDMQGHFDRVVVQVQTNFKNALDLLVDKISEQMVPISKERAQKLEAIHTDVKTVPGEVWRLGEPRLGTLQGGIRSDLEPLIANLQQTLEDGFQRIEDGIAQRLDALGEEISPAVRGMINVELQQYQRQATKQFEKVTLLLDALRDDLAHRHGEGADNPAGVPFGTPESKHESPGETALPSEPVQQQANDEKEQ